MKTPFLASLALILSASFLRAEPLPAPTALTGTYSGTLTHERSITVLTETPPRVVKLRRVMRVAGVATIPAGHTRPLIQLIFTPTGVFDIGLENAFDIDFEPIPATATLYTSQTNYTNFFPTITVEGKKVKVIVQSAASDAVIKTQNVTTLRLTRTKP